MQIERYIARESERDAAAWISSGRMAVEDRFRRKYRLQCSREIRRRRGSLFFLPGSQSHCVTHGGDSRRRSPLLLLLLSSRRKASRRVCRAVNSTVRAIEFETSR